VLSQVGPGPGSIKQLTGAVISTLDSERTSTQIKLIFIGLSLMKRCRNMHWSQCAKAILQVQFHLVNH